MTVNKRFLMLVILAVVAAACGSDEIPTARPEAIATSTTSEASSPPESSSTVPEPIDSTETTSSATTVVEDDYGFPAGDDDETTTTVGEDPVDRSDRQTESPTKLPERVPASETSATVGEVPEPIMSDILAHAAEQTGVSANEFTVVRAEQVVWSDGSLGCPEPGVFYTQATVAGYWVVLDSAGVTYDYRATGDGHFRVCGMKEAGPAGPASVLLAGRD